GTDSAPDAPAKSIRGAPALPALSHEVEVMHLQRPVRRDGVEIDVGELGPAVHLPEHRGAVVVAPDEVGLAVAVEVAAPLDVPVGRDLVEVDVDELGAAVHLPENRGAVDVAPDEVTLAVAVEVAEALDAPIRGDLVEIDVGELAAAIHLPQHRLAVA